MNLPNELTQQVKTHLDEVRKYLGNLPADERQEILQSIESHIYDALENRSDGEPSPALLDAVIAEMDPPESYNQSPIIASVLSADKSITAPPGAATNKSGMVRIVELFFDLTFKSPLAIRLINISALGFLGALGFLRALPFSGSHRCAGFFGFTGFFGLIGLAFIIELFARREKNRSAEQRRFAEMDPPESYGELPPTKQSRSVMKPFVSAALVLTAILGIWIAFGINKENTPAKTLTAAESKHPPVVVSTFPLNGNNAVDPNITELRVTFNKDMLTDRMWSWCTESQDTAPKFVSKGTKFIDKRTCVTPVDLEPNKRYVVWINTQKNNTFRDIYHNPAVPHRLEFRTGNVQSLIASIPDKSKDSVGISSITPSINKDLISGETVIFEVEVEYNLVTSDTASITLVIQRSESGHRPLANETAVIKKGKGKITISTAVEIPDTKAIQIFTPLSVPGAMQTTVVDSRIYSVKATSGIKQTPEPKPVAFEQGCNTLKEGDSIVLDEVLSSSPYFVEGDIITVKGQYTLSSQPDANLALYVTGTQGRGRSTVIKEQRTEVVQGTGDFTLTATIPYPGRPHLSFYDKITGQSLGGLYFGIKEQVEKIEVLSKNADTQKGETMHRSLTLAATSILAATNLLAGEVQVEFRLQEAIDNASSGDTIIIPSGTYTEPVIIRKKITLNGRDAIFKVKANRPAIQIDTSRPVTLRNLKIQYKTEHRPTREEFPYAVYTSGGDLLIEDCIFQASGSANASPCAVLATDKSTMHIKNSRFEGFNYTIQFGNGSEGSVEDCLIMNPGHCGITIGRYSAVNLKQNIVTGSRYHGIRCTGGEINADSNLIIRNANRGFYLGAKSVRGTLSNNLIIDNATGINVYAYSDLEIVNNVILRSSYAGLAIIDTATLDIEDNVIADNEKGVVGFASEPDWDPSISLKGKNLVYGNTVQCEKLKLPSKTIETDPQFKDANSGLFSMATSDAKGIGLTNPAEMQTLWKKWKAETGR